MKGKVLGKAMPLAMTSHQHAELPQLAVGKGGYQTVFAKINDSVRIVNGVPTATVYTNELDKLKEWAQRSDAGSWQDWARAVLTANNLI